MRIKLTVNGRTVTAELEARVSLADFLRESIGCTGVHLGCEQGVCGSCTAILDGVAVRTCLMFAVQADGAEIRTVEGLSSGEDLHPLQQAFHDAGGLQCGFCTGGMLMAALPLYERGRRLTPREIRDEIGGNLCRCTGYTAIVAAIASAVDRKKSS
jgi:carbon-monoxide dehydrogenase small subunit